MTLFSISKNNSKRSPQISLKAFMTMSSRAPFFQNEKGICRALK